MHPNICKKKTQVIQDLSNASNFLFFTYLCETLEKLKYSKLHVKSSIRYTVFPQSDATATIFFCPLFKAATIRGSKYELQDITCESLAFTCACDY